MDNERVPKESETIAARRSLRVAEKLAKTRAALSFTRVWWNNGAIEFVGLFGVLILNFYLVYSFFGTAAAQTAFSGPLIPILAKLIEFISRTPLPYALQIVYICFFLGFPLSFYFLVKKITGRKIAAFCAILITSLPFGPFAALRAQSALIEIEGPHISSLTLIPLAIFGLLSFIRVGGVKNLIIASFFAGATVLTSPFGFFAFMAFAAITSFSEMLLGKGRLKFIRFLAVLIFTAALSSFWYNPSFFIWMITGPLGIEIRQTISKLIPISLFAIPALGAFGFLLFDRKPELQPVFLASFFTIAFAIVVMAGGGFFPSHPVRYMPEFGISLSFLISIIILRLADYLRFIKNPNLTLQTKELLANGLTIVIFFFLISGILLGGEIRELGYTSVLGLWTGFDKSEIWVSKDRFGGISALAGYVISALAVGTLGFFYSRVRRTNED